MSKDKDQADSFPTNSTNDKLLSYRVREGILTMPWLN
jgi:hypothetical protein